MYTELRDPAARAAFLHVLRHVIDWRGQIVTMRDRAYRAAGMPTLILWGAADHVLPVRHAVAMNRDMPHSRLIVLPEVGHFPHRERPETFAQAVIDFVGETAPSKWDARRWRALLRARMSAEPAAQDGEVRRDGLAAERIGVGQSSARRRRHSTSASVGSSHANDP